MAAFIVDVANCSPRLKAVMSHSVCKVFLMPELHAAVTHVRKSEPITSLGFRNLISDYSFTFFHHLHDSIARVPAAFPRI